MDDAEADAEAYNEFGNEVEPEGEQSWNVPAVDSMGEDTYNSFEDNNANDDDGEGPMGESDGEDAESQGGEPSAVYSDKLSLDDDVGETSEEMAANIQEAGVEQDQEETPADRNITAMDGYGEVLQNAHEPILPNMHQEDNLEQDDPRSLPLNGEGSKPKVDFDDKDAGGYEEDWQEELVPVADGATLASSHVQEFDGPPTLGLEPSVENSSGALAQHSQGEDSPYAKSDCEAGSQDPGDEGDLEEDAQEQTLGVDAPDPAVFQGSGSGQEHSMQSSTGHNELETGGSNPGDDKPDAVVDAAGVCAHPSDKPHESSDNMGGSQRRSVLEENESVNWNGTGPVEPSDVADADEGTRAGLESLHAGLELTVGPPPSVTAKVIEPRLQVLVPRSSSDNEDPSDDPDSGAAVDGVIAKVDRMMRMTMATYATSDREGSVRNQGPSKLTFSAPPYVPKAKPYARADYSHSPNQMRKIAHDNEVLVKKLIHISQHTPTWAADARTPPAPGNVAAASVNRRRAAVTTAQENHALYQRLVNAKPSKEVERVNLAHAHAQHEAYGRNCRTFRSSPSPQRGPRS